jgi:hypothetical protein
LATADLKHLCHVEDNPPLAEAARAVNARLRAVVDWVQTTWMSDTPVRQPKRRPRRTTQGR